MSQIITLLCGGCSPEHEISLLSAKNWLSTLQKLPVYSVQVVYLAQDRSWRLLKSPQDLISSKGSQQLSQAEHVMVTPILGLQLPQLQAINAASQVQVTGDSWPLGVVVPMLHGEQGEDGSMQGLLQMLGVPFVGAGVLGSAVSMDKHVSKMLLTQAGIGCVPWRCVDADQLQQLDLKQLTADFTYPLFVKPTNAGSSLGISKVQQEQALLPALRHACEYAPSAIIEPAIEGRELECAVLGAHRAATAPGEIKIIKEAYGFYDYKAKYVDSQAAQVIVPADLDAKIAKKLSEIAWKAAQVLQCKSIARVDFFLDPQGVVYLNEVNSMPGFTSISMYSRLWEQQGVMMPQLVQHLIEDALGKFQL